MHAKPPRVGVLAAVDAMLELDRLHERVDVGQIAVQDGKRNHPEVKDARLRVLTYGMRVMLRRKVKGVNLLKNKL